MTFIDDGRTYSRVISDKVAKRFIRRYGGSIKKEQLIDDSIIRVLYNTFDKALAEIWL